MKADELGFVVDRIYEAAARPELWRPVLHEMAKATDAKGVQILHMRPEGSVLHTASEGLDEVLKTFFAEGWNRQNPRSARARALVVGVNEVITDRDLFTAEELDRDPWQRDFLDRFGLRWFCSLPLRPAFEAAPFYLSIERLAVSSPFGDDEKAMIERILPHLQRAFRMSVALGAAAQDGMMDAFTALKQPALLLDDQGRLVRHNAVADEQLGDGITVSAGRLRATDRSANARLQELLASVCHAGAACEAPAYDAIALPCRDGRPLIVQAAPLVSSARDLFQQGRALVLLSLPDQELEPDEDFLRFAFNLTPAEAKVAHSVGTRGGAVAASEALGLSSNTVRTHLKAVFAKTGTHSQSALAVLLSRLPRRMA